MTPRVWTVLVASLFLLTAACSMTAGDKADRKTTDDKETTTEGDDESTTIADGGDGIATTDDATTTGDGGSGGGDIAAFCDASAEAEELLGNTLAAGDFEGFVEAVSEADDLFDAYVGSLPDDLRDEGELLVDTLRKLAAEVDRVKDDSDAAEKAEAAFKALETPEQEAASKAVTVYEDTCPET